jgi:ABC-type transport system involved in multi-copper enzyme maturation permease subunit
MTDKKAQASMEMIFIATFVIIICVVILGYFNSIKSSTVAISLAKANTLDALNKSSKNFTIQKIDFTEGAGSIEINILTMPASGIECLDINGSGTRQLIIEKAGYSAGTVTIKANSNPC